MCCEFLLVFNFTVNIISFFYLNMNTIYPQIWDPNENNDNDDEGNDKKEMDEIDAETAGKQPDGQYGAKDEKTNESEEKPLDKDEAEDGNDKQKEINEMDDEQPVDDDQIDPYHGMFVSFFFFFPPLNKEF